MAQAHAADGADVPVRVLHLSDIHCGRPFVAAHLAAALELARASRWDAIVVSGDLSQRARPTEFAEARDLLTAFRAVAPLLVVPGNHDTAWWRAPFGMGAVSELHREYRTYIDATLEPSLRVPGVSVIGLNSAWGMCPPALTWYPRDWRVKGGLSDAQLADAAQRAAGAPPNDLRLLVVHHNVVRGRLSRRWGLAHPWHALDAIAAMPVDVVCTGHDHEERIEVVERPTGRFLLSAANTLSNRMRGHRPSALNVIEATATRVTARAWTYEAAERGAGAGRFVPGPMQATLARTSVPASALASASASASASALVSAPAAAPVSSTVDLVGHRA